MNILDVSPRVSSTMALGSSVRTHNLLRYLSRRHEVRQFSRARRDQRVPTGQTWPSPSYCEIRHWNPLTAAVGWWAERSWPRAPLLSGVELRLARPETLNELISWAEVILVEFPWQFEYCRQRSPGAPVVLAGHNLESSKFEDYARAMRVGGRSKWWLRMVRQIEERAVRHADLVLVVSDADRNALIERHDVAPSRIAVIPNGADSGRYKPVDDQRRRHAKDELGLPPGPTVLFAGSNVAPNRAGLEWVRMAARDAPELNFLVVGNICTPRRERNLIATGFVEDFGRHLEAADLSICPIEYGGGTKIKLLEALAAGLPTVVFREALHGLEVRDQEHVLVCEKRVPELVRTLRRLRDDQLLAKRLSRSARLLVDRRYSWEAIGQRLETALQRLVSARVSDSRQSSRLSATNTA